MTNTNKNGIAVIFHCVPSKITPEIEAFWNALHEDLNKVGMEILIITTTELENKKIPHLHVPFLLTEYFNPYQDLKNLNFNINHPLIDGLSKWYKIDEVKSKNIFHIVWDFYESLIDAVEPALIISWQSMHPVSRIVREISIERGIPWWAAERGWVKNTLMIDMGENNFLSELTSSYSLARVYDSYKINDKLINLYIEKTKNYGSIERYPNKSIGDFEIRKKYGLPDSTKIFAFFTHGEPHVGAMNSLYGMQRQHELLPNYLYEQIVKISKFLEQRGDFLVVKEHPFNNLNKTNFNFDGLSNVIVLNESVDDIINSCDYFLFSLSTLQVEIALLGKPFGVLCRGFLTGDNEAPLVSDFDSIKKFICEIENKEAWKLRQAAIEKRISFLIEFFLIELDGFNFENSVKRLAAHFRKHRGLNQDLAKHRLISWLDKRE